MNLSDPSEADGSLDASSNLFRILISSDIHLGRAEKDSERGVDSFNRHDELHGIGVKEVLLGGNLIRADRRSSSESRYSCSW